MKQQKKDVIILIDHVDLDSVDASILRESDRIALTTDAMLAFEEGGYSYITLEDIYSHKEFRINNSNFIESTENLFSGLDKKYEPMFEFPRAFTGNILYFLYFFANVHYISKICESIKRDYKKIYLIGTSQYNGEFNIKMDFSLNGMAFHSFNIGLINKVSMFKEYLSPHCTWMNGDSFGGLNLEAIWSNFRRILPLACKGLHSVLSRKKSLDNKGVIYIIQDSYDVKFLKKTMLEFEYVKPLGELKKMTADGMRCGCDIDLSSDTEIHDFTSKWFLGYEKHILELFSVYGNSILTYFKSFLKYVHKKFDQDKPVALYFSTGANRICEEIYAYIANKRNIPVFYFQHGGVTIFYKHPYQKYIEQNPHVKKISLYHSKIEKDIFVDDSSSEGHALGSTRLYDLYNSYSKDQNKAGKREKLLYCVSAFNSHNYRDLMTNITDKELFRVNNDVVDSANRLGLRMDIKVHPSDEAYNYFYFKHLLNQKRYKGIRVLRGFPIERTINDYSLLILDYIGSALVPISLVLDIPIILYLKDSSFLREEAILDLRKRFYIAQNSNDLKQYLLLHKAKKLGSKFSLDIIDEHVFRINSKEPSSVVSDFIKTRLSAKETV